LERCWSEAFSIRRLAANPKSTTARPLSGLNAFSITIASTSWLADNQPARKALRHFAENLRILA